MTKVNTVLGPVAMDQLGRVLMHEHLVCYNLGWELDPRHSQDTERDLHSLSSQLADLRQYGVKTIVDATPVDLGRNVGFIVEASRRSGINIVACTGIYNMHAAFPPYFRVRSVDEIADWMVWELTEGMGKSGVKAGAIKVATGLDKIARPEEKAIRAAARAHKRTGAPILTHTESGKLGKEQVDLFEEEGADLSRVIIGHCCGNGDLRYHLDILKRGANVGIDRIGIDFFMSDEIRRGIVMGAMAAGYGSQIMLSQDRTPLFYGAHPQVVQALTKMPQTYAYVLTDFIPKLREGGVSERAIETCLSDLPRKFFGG